MNNPAPRAIIDIGSNTVRLVIYGGPLRAPIVLHNEKVTAKLGKNLADHGRGEGRLGNKAMEAALAALARYAAMLRLGGIGDVECVATAAVRDATNGGDFLARVTALGLSPRLLSGEEEAVTSARGVMGAFPGATGVVGDLGGGSLELVDIGGGVARHGSSLPLGTLRLAGLRAGGAAKFGGRVRKLLRSADWARDAQSRHGQTFYLVGGSWRALARYAMHRQAWPVDDPHGFVLTAEAALKLARQVARSKRPARKNVAGAAAERETAERRRAAAMGLSASRYASLPDAAALLAVLVRQLQPSRLVFSSWGLREGLLAARMPATARAADPLLVSVTAFVATQDAGVAANAMLADRWIAEAVGGPAVGGHDEGARTPLRRAAVMLALASMRTEPNLRAELAVEWGLRKRWIGVDDEGRAMLALALLANNGRTAIPPDLMRLAPIGRLREALSWGLAVRLCRRLTGVAVETLAHSALTIEGDTLILRLAPAYAALRSDAVDKDLRLLAESLGLAARFVETGVRVSA